MAQSFALLSQIHLGSGQVIGISTEPRVGVQRVHGCHRQGPPFSIKDAKPNLQSRFWQSEQQRRRRARLNDLPSLQFGGDAVSAPAEEALQGEDNAHHYVRHQIVNGVRPLRLGAQGGESFPLGGAMPLPDVAGAQREVPRLGRLPTSQSQLHSPLLGHLLLQSPISAHHLDAELELPLLGAGLRLCTIYYA